MKKRFAQRVVVVFIILLTSLGSFAPAAAQDSVVTVTITSERVTWVPHVENSGLVLTIAGPDYYHQQEYSARARPTFRPYRSPGNPLPDGVYTYELQLLPVFDRDAQPRVDEAERGLVPVGNEDAIVVSGSFSVLDGSFVTQDVEEGEEEIDAAGALTPADVLHYDDVIITGSLCVGFDCQDGESFGFDTQILKEHNLRIYFNDTSYTASYPTNNWRITINDSTNGGASYFSIDDVDDGTSIFKIEAGAPSNSLYVEDYGRVGLGTSTPVVELHIKDSDTPTVRLEQDGSGGWTPQTWDVAGNESNFFIRDATNGSKLPFRIQPSTPSSTLNLKSDGKVGIGTWSPAYPLELETTGEDATFVAERTSGAKAKISARSSEVQLGSQSNHDVRFVTNDTTRMTISGGDVGIGTTGPDTKLHVYENDTGTFPGLIVDQDGTGDAVLTVRLSGMQAYSIGIDNNDSDKLKISGSTLLGSGDLVTVESGGNVGVGTTSPGYKLHVNGSAGKPGGGDWSVASDARLKENIRGIGGRQALDALNRLQGVTFEWINPEEHSTGTRAGLIAQEVEKVFPDWVEEYEAQGSDAALIPEDEQAKALHLPNDFNAYVIEAIKALDAENQALSEIVEEQDAAIAALQQQNADLEARLTALEEAAGATNNRTYSLPLGGMLLGGLVVVGVVAAWRRRQ